MPSEKATAVIDSPDSTRRTASSLASAENDLVRPCPKALRAEKLVDANPVHHSAMPSFNGSVETLGDGDRSAGHVRLDPL